VLVHLAEVDGDRDREIELLSARIDPVVVGRREEHRREARVRDVRSREALPARAVEPERRRVADGEGAGGRGRERGCRDKRNGLRSANDGRAKMGSHATVWSAEAENRKEKSELSGIPGGKREPRASTARSARCQRARQRARIERRVAIAFSSSASGI